MPKSLFLLLCLTLLTSACNSEAPVAEENDEPTTEEMVEEEVAVEEVVEEAVTFESSRETTVATGSSELEDDTAYGFAYNSSNVLDLDYSTSWCSTEEGVPQVLTLSFPEATKLGTVGIVGGYARDEKIFLQNNRLKTVEVWYDDLPEAVDELHFEDVYGMQFFDLTQEEAQTVKFKIMETYPGSKYTDTCVAEVDLWSEWVGQKDADAALNYYQSYKEDAAKRPVGIADLDMIFADEYYNISVDDVTTSCGTIDTTYITKDLWWDGSGSFDYMWKDNGVASDSDRTEFLGTYHTDPGLPVWFAFAGMDPILSAKLNEWAVEGDEFEVRWVQTSAFMEIAPRLIEMETVQAQACSDGSLYIWDVFEGEGGEGMGGFTVEVYYQDHLVGRTTMSLMQ